MKFFLGCSLALAILAGEALAASSKLMEQRRLEADFLSAMGASAPRRKGPVKKNHLNDPEFQRRLIQKARKLENDEDQQEAGEEQNQEQADEEQGQQEDQAEDQDWVNEYYYADGLVDLTLFSFKYAGCSAVKEFAGHEEGDDGGDDDDESPFVARSFAVFRLCPSTSCNKYSMSGCSRNYGEYLVEMQDYLQMMSEYYAARKESYCEVCEVCTYEKQQEAQEYLAECYLEKYQQYAQNNYEEYQNQYANENGDQDEDADQDQDADADQDQDADQENADYQYGGYAAYNGFNNYGNRRKMQQQGNQQGQGEAGQEEEEEMDQYTQQQMMKIRYGESGITAYYQAAGISNTYDWQNDWENLEYDPNAMAAAAYGFYDQDGTWVQGNDEALEWLQSNNGYLYWMVNNGFYGQDGFYYAFNNDFFDQDDGNDCFEEFEENYYCSNQMFYDCSEYFVLCTEEGQEYAEEQGEPVFDAMDYVECTQSPNNGAYYLAPHCGADHNTITLGVYTDEDCLNSVGEYISLETALGMEIDDSNLFSFPEECIYCDAGDNMEDLDGNEVAYEYKNNYSGMGVVAMCEYLYDEAATCNMHLNAWSDYVDDMDYADVVQEEANCAYIDNIMSGSYDEEGEIVIASPIYDLSDWRNLEGFKHAADGIPKYEIVLLALSALLMVIMFIALFFTQRELNQVGTAWRPKMSFDGVDRQDSGIHMARSEVHNGTTPLI